MSEHYNKIHFEMFSETSITIHQHLKLPEKPFYDIIDTIDERMKNQYTAFPCDDACHTYIETIFEKLKSIIKDPSMTSMDKMRSRFWDTYMPYMFYKSGKKVFRPTVDLVHMLIDTSIKNIDTYFIQSPFKCIFISIPKEVKLMNPFNIPIDGLYIAVFNKEDIHYEGFSEKYHEYEKYENSKNLVICSISDMVISPNDPRETMHYWNIALKDGDLHEQISPLLDAYDKEYHKKDFESCNKDYDRTFLENILSFCLNSLLYINSKDPSEFKLETTKKDISNIKNKAKIRQASKRTRLPFYHLGGNITIDHSYKNVINMYDRETVQHRKLVGKWVVRGHWRNQAHGKESKERKLIWIQPFVKGEEFAEVIEKGYVVK